ncbi:MAG: hypothetical protein MI747_12790 [Desulfobacterales bacterium]|nr:hypothetical protein [Desulfobacterales bacterium]
MADYMGFWMGQDLFHGPYSLNSAPVSGLAGGLLSLVYFSQFGEKIPSGTKVSVFS